MNDNHIPEMKIYDDQSLDKWGIMALEYLKEEYPMRYQTLLEQGTLMSKVHEMQKSANDKMLEVIDNLLKQNPMPRTEDILIKTKHINSLTLIAEDFVIETIINIPN